MKFSILLIAIFYSCISVAQTPIDTAKIEEEDFSMYADVEAAASSDKSKIYCSQKILGLSPSKLISIGFDFVGANAIDTDTIGSYFGNKADFNNNPGIRFAANFPVISNNKVILS
jgi:hypothetical protein